MLKHLPREITELIYTYDNTYHEKFKYEVLPQMIMVIRNKIYGKLITFADSDYTSLYDFISQDHFPLFLFYNHNKFYQLDKKFFNNYFKRLMLNYQGFYLQYTYPF